MSHHTARLSNSKLREDGGRNIGQSRTGRVNRPIAQQHAGNQRVIHTMVAAPWVRVVLEDVRGEVPQDGLPSRAITAVVAHQQIWSLTRIRPLVNLAGPVHAR